MKQQNLAQISRVSGKSVSTVSKVLRGCGGVDDETREAVICAASNVCLAPYAPQKNDIFVILPDNPKYFWHRAFTALKERETSVTLRIFSAIRADERNLLVERYIEEAVASGARVLILSAYLNEKLRARVAELATHMLIIQVCEYIPIPNTFFVGSDGARDGGSLAGYLPTDTERVLNVGVLTGAVSHASTRRVEGFLAALPESVSVYRIEKPKVIELYASHLARAIDALGVPLDYLFSFDGITSAACDAIYKLRGKMHTRLLGFEYPPTAEKHMHSGRIAALAVQKPDEQMRVALRLADRYLRQRIYPDQKYSFVPSDLVSDGMKYS